MNVGWYAVTPHSRSAFPRAAIAVRVGGEEVDAREPVHLQVDEARRRNPAPGLPFSPTASMRPSATSTSPGRSRRRRALPRRPAAPSAPSLARYLGRDRDVDGAKSPRRSPDRRTAAGAYRSPPRPPRRQEERAAGRSGRASSPHARAADPSEGPGGWAAVSTRSPRSSGCCGTSTWTSCLGTERLDEQDAAAKPDPVAQPNAGRTSSGRIPIATRAPRVREAGRPATTSAGNSSRASPILHTSSRRPRSTAASAGSWAATRRSWRRRGSSARRRTAAALSTCCRTPSRMTATRCPIVIASTWSCVTYSVVTFSACWMRAISPRICTRSFASRFESGSSMRKAFGSRTIARPIATRCR